MDWEILAFRMPWHPHSATPRHTVCPHQVATRPTRMSSPEWHMCCRRTTRTTCSNATALAASSRAAQWITAYPWVPTAARRCRASRALCRPTGVWCRDPAAVGDCLQDPCIAHTQHCRVHVQQQDGDIDRCRTTAAGYADERAWACACAGCDARVLHPMLHPVRRNALYTRALSGPTLFGPLLKQAAATASTTSGFRYTVCLILTDGCIHDMQVCFLRPWHM